MTKTTDRFHTAASLIRFVGSNAGESKHTQVKGLILAQNERWRRGLGMRVARECSNTGKRRKGEDNMGICPGDEDSVGKLTVILDNVCGPKVRFRPWMSPCPISLLAV
jgi:hypothetical protein